MAPITKLFLPGRPSVKGPERGLNVINNHAGYGAQLS